MRCDDGKIGYHRAMSWDPIRDLRAWQERFGRLSSPHPEPWAPAIDVYETADSYVITAEVPGLAREQIELALEESRLTIRGQRNDRGVSAGDILRFQQVERGHGAFARTFEFAESVDAESVSAELSNGVLSVKLSKASPAPARRIEVK